jgi:hypothetical protein
MSAEKGAATVIPLERLLPRVRVTLGAEEATLRDGPLVRAAVDLLRTIESVGALAGAMSREGSIRMLGLALQRFARALLGPEASDEVVDGMTYVALLHMVSAAKRAAGSDMES